jgi:hypothetical protein
MPPDQSIVDALRVHWRADNDLYFAVSDGSITHIWYTGDTKNDPQNILKANVFDLNAMSGDVKLTTYGGAGKGRLRVGIGAKFNLPTGTLLENRMYNNLRLLVRETLLTEELTKSDKKEIERIARKQVQRDLIDKKEIEKIARKEAEAEIKKALGVSFMGSKGKINKFVVDEIQKEVQKWLKDRATKQEVADITKEVMIKVYRALSFSYRPLIDRIRI